MRKFKVWETKFLKLNLSLKVAPNLRGFVDQNGSKFVQSSIVARAAELGQDYVVYSDRNNK